MSVELNAGQLKRNVEHELIPRLVGWQKGHVDRSVAERLSDVIVEAFYEVALIAREEGAERGILAGVKMIRNWQD